jgi:hypothetical protein
VTAITTGVTEKDENFMTYVSAAVTSIDDVAAFAEAGKSWASARLAEMGALSTTANQVIMGGEAAGAVTVAFEWESIDAAMAGQAALYADADMLTLMKDTGVNLHRRSLMRVQAEFGTRTGDVGSVLYLGGPQLDDATAQANYAVSWAHVQKGANGVAALRNVAAGPSPFSATVATWADSLDSLMAASAEGFADPKVQELMTSTGTQVLGRLLTRRLF